MLKNECLDVTIAALGNYAMSLVIEISVAKISHF